MKPKIVIISLLFLFLGCKEHSKAKHGDREKYWYDDENFVKDTLYILWEEGKNDGKEQQKIFSYKVDYKNQTYVNLVFGKGAISETLCIKELQYYKVVSQNELDSLEISWAKKNRGKLEKLYSKDYWHRDWCFYGPDRNGMFVTYLVRIGDDKKSFTIYPVIWEYDEVGCEFIIP